MNRVQLLSALNIVKPCLSNNLLIPTLSYINFSNGMIETSNGVQGIQTKFEHGLNCCIVGEPLIKILNSFNTDEVDIIEEEYGVDIKAGSTLVTLNSNKSENFPSIFSTIKEEKKGKEIEITESFSFGIEKCLTSSNKNMFQEAQNGVTIFNDTLYSTDNVRLSKFLLDTDYQIKVILPETFCKQISNFKNNILTIYKNYAILENETTRVLTSIRDIKLLNYPMVFEKFVVPEEMCEISSDFKKVLERCLIILTDTEKVVKVETKGNDMILRGLSTKGGIYEELTFSFPFIESNFKVNVELLNKSFKELKEFSIIKSNNDYLFVGRDNDFTTIIASA